MRHFMLIAAAFVPASALAGDVAHLHVLGWSADGNRVALVQSGVNEKSGFSYAKLRILDVASGKFAPDGRFDASPSAQSDDDAAALTAVLDASVTVRKKAGLDGSRPGQIVFYRPEGAREADFAAGGKAYKVRLAKIGNPAPGEAPTQRFAVELHADGKTTPLAAEAEWQDALDYTLRVVRLSPDGKSMLVLLTASLPGSGGPSTRHVPLVARLSGK